MNQDCAGASSPELTGGSCRDARQLSLNCSSVWGGIEVAGSMWQNAPQGMNAHTSRSSTACCITAAPVANSRPCDRPSDT